MRQVPEDHGTSGKEDRVRSRELKTMKKRTIDKEGFRLLADQAAVVAALFGISLAVLAAFAAAALAGAAASFAFLSR